MKRSVTCHCDNLVEFELPDVIESSANSTVEKEILNGSFATVKCEKCGDELRPEIELTLRDQRSPHPYHVISEKNRNRFLAGHYEHPEGVRIVIGFPELREKVQILHDGYDEEAIEMVKFQIMKRAGAGTDMKIYFVDTSSDHLTFHLHGLRDDEIGVMKIAMVAYEKALAEVPVRRGEEPYSAVLEPPYVSVHKIELERETDAS